MSDEATPTMKQTYFNLAGEQYELAHRIKTLQHLQESIIQSALLLGSVLHTPTLTEVVESLHNMRSDLERQALALQLKQNIKISDASRGNEV